MHAIAARLGFNLVSLRLELFGQRRDRAGHEHDTPASTAAEPSGSKAEP
jgi:hypothetical protein